MNNRQIIAPLLAIVLVAFASAFIFSRNQSRDFLKARALQIGHDLVTQTNSPGVVHLGENLKGTLEDMMQAPTGVSAFEFGDAPRPMDNCKASACLYVTNATGTCIGIRLRPDSGTEKLHIVGFWTVSRPN